MKSAAAVVHPWLRLGGGSEMMALLLCDVLARDRDVELFTMGVDGLEGLERESGVDLRGGGIRVIVLPMPAAFRRRFDAIRFARLSRHVRARAAEFGLLASGYNVFDFGRPGLQLVADFSFDDATRRALGESPRGLLGWAYAASPARSAYLGAGRILAGGRRAGWMRNETVTVSRWTRDLLASRFGLESTVVYPPVAGDFPAVPWPEREDGIVVMGRATPSKGLERAIEIVRRVRAGGRDLHLHVVARPDDPSYTRRLKLMCRDSGGWAVWEGPVFGDAKKALLSRHRYGISCRTYETFGIAVAEMVKAGCIVWVPEGGGQIEIVDHPDLTFRSPDDAAAAIAAVCRDGGRQAAMRAHLARRGGLFSREEAKRGLAEVVARFEDSRSRETLPA